MLDKPPEGDTLGQFGDHKQVTEHSEYICKRESNPGSSNLSIKGTILQNDVIGTYPKNQKNTYNGINKTFTFILERKNTLFRYFCLMIRLVYHKKFSSCK